MGGLNKTGVNVAHDSALLSAEVARQAAVTGLGTGPSAQVTMNNSEISFHRAVVASCRVNNSNVGLEGSLSALKALGVSA